MLECHHKIFKSQGGLDFEINYKYLTSEDHRGNSGPHQNKKTDLIYKREVERDLRKVLIDKHYTKEELIEILGLNVKQAHKAFSKVRNTSQGMYREDIIKRLLGGRYYL